MDAIQIPTLKHVFLPLVMFKQMSENIAPKCSTCGLGCLSDPAQNPYSFHCQNPIAIIHLIFNKIYCALYKFIYKYIFLCNMYLLFFRQTLDTKYGLKRWQIGEIASKIGQLYYHY